MVSWITGSVNETMKKTRAGITLLEVLLAMTILSTILLPIGMFLLEYVKGSSELGEFHQVMNLLEEKMEMALSQPFRGIPNGESKDTRLTFNGKEVVDLRPAQIGGDVVKFTLTAESFPVQFSACTDPAKGTNEVVRVEEGLKKLTIKGTWGKKTTHTLDLVAYKADL